MDLDEDLHKLAETSATPESLVIEHSGIDAVRSAIEQLPPIYREVILLCDVKDKSYRQIAEILSIPIGTVMSRLARARKAVRECLCNDPGAPQSRDLSHYIEAHEKGRYSNSASLVAGLMPRGPQSRSDELSRELNQLNRKSNRQSSGFQLAGFAAQIPEG